MSTRNMIIDAALIVLVVWGFRHAITSQRKIANLRMGRSADAPDLDDALDEHYEDLRRAG